MTQIEIIKALSDNYIYVLHNPINKQTAVIDPGEAQPVIELLEKKNWKLSHIFNTHHHDDHIGGIKRLSTNITVNLLLQNMTKIKYIIAIIMFWMEMKLI